MKIIVSWHDPKEEDAAITCAYEDFEIVGLLSAAAIEQHPEVYSFFVDAVKDFEKQGRLMTVELIPDKVKGT